MTDIAEVLLRAAWVCPVNGPPIAGGWVAVGGGRIVGVGAGHDAPAAAKVVDLGDDVLLPGLVNAHTHLELSWLRGRVPPGPDFLTWVGAMMGLRSGLERPGDPATDGPARAAIDEMMATGTVAVGDISNALVTPALLAEAGLPGVVFHELLGFRVTDGRRAVESALSRHAGLASKDVRLSLAPHAPFSVSRELFEAIREAVAAMEGAPTSVHLGESPEEVTLLRTGGGPWRDRLQTLGAWRDGWTAPGCGPGDYLVDLGVVGPRTLVVHAGQLSDAELARVAEAGATVVTCPRSNVWVGVGPPPVARFLASGVALALGTDSLASVDDLNLFEELAALRRLAPEAPARRLLAAATQGGADALGLGADLGAIAPGRRAAVIAVRMPRGVGDPEDALVAGVEPARIRPVPVASYHGWAH
ncbi:MAG: amidohydrolase family protein [Vicinamibacterales bacterium]